jgi:hypothetical protein
MPNVDNPHGLSPLGRTLSGGLPTIESFTKAASFGTALFIGDAVARAADGTINTTITPGTTLYSGVNLQHGAASTLTDHLVMTSPDALFEAQDNNDTDGFAAADMGLNVNLELNAGSAATQLSGHELDESTIQTTNTLDVKLLRLLGSPDNAYGAYGRYEIVFNKHRMFGNVAGV